MGKCKALYDYKAAEDGELSFKAGDILEVLAKDPGGWWRGKTNQGVEGFFPCNYVLELSTEDLLNYPLPSGWERAVDPKSQRIYFKNKNTNSTSWNHPTTGAAGSQSTAQLQNKGLGRCVALYDYSANDTGELSFRQHDVIKILQKDPSGWWQGELNGVVGVFPSAEWVKELPDDSLSETTLSHANRKEEVEISQYRKLAEQGSSEAQYNLGLMYCTGQGVRRDDAEAVLWYRKAADQGYADAQYGLGNMYSTGRGVRQDNAQAVLWYRKAADQGHAKAQYSLGVMYANGRGVPKDIAQAVFWYRKAADQGLEEAQAQLKRISAMSPNYSPNHMASSLKKPEAPPTPNAISAFKAVSLPSAAENNRLSRSTSMTSIADEIKIASNAITLKELLGEGGFGKVYRGSWDGVDVAVKTLTTKENQNIMTDFAKEMNQHAKMRHPHIVLLYGVVIEPSPMIVLEFCNGGTLSSLIRGDSPLTWERKTQLAIGIARGINYLHSVGVIHRDLKTENVLLNDGVVKLADFGLAKDSQMTTATTATGMLAGTVTHMPPEILDGSQKPTEKADIYALGVILWEMASRRRPYENCLITRIMLAVMSGNREEIPPDTPIEWTSLIKSCWDQNPNIRPTAAQVVSSLEAYLATCKSNGGTNTESVVAARPSSGFVQNSASGYVPAANSGGGQAPTSGYIYNSGQINRNSTGSKVRWEQRIDPKGKPYFVDHKNRTTLRALPADANINELL